MSSTLAAVAVPAAAIYFAPAGSFGRMAYSLLVAIGSTLLYAYTNSTLSRRPRNTPCPDYGAVFRVAYGLFGMRIAEMVLAHFNQTKEDEEQGEQVGGTQPLTVGEPELRVKMLPILGQLFGGNYAFLLWDEADPEKRAIVVDPADPQPVLRAAKAEGLRIEIVLTTHWHFDHAGGNRALARAIPGLQVVGGAGERQITPAVTKKLRDLEEITLGRIVVRGHAVPGHTYGSTVFEVFSRDAAGGTPTSAFTGDALFCGGCGALFECSASAMHESLAKLVSRLPLNTRIFPGHEYTQMLLEPLVRKRPRTLADAAVQDAAKAKLLDCLAKRERKEPSIPSTLSEELSYNPHLRANPQQLAQMCGVADE